MKLTLKTDLVGKMTLDRFPQAEVPWKDWQPHLGPNYLVYDSHRDAPTGFAIRVGKKASVYLVEKLVAGADASAGGIQRAGTADRGLAGHRAA